MRPLRTSAGGEPAPSMAVIITVAWHAWIPAVEQCEDDGRSVLSRGIEDLLDARIEVACSRDEGAVDDEELAFSRWARDRR